MLNLLHTMVYKSLAPYPFEGS